MNTCATVQDVLVTSDQRVSELLAQMGKRHTATLFRWAVARSESPADAWDLVQQTFVRALDRRPLVVTDDDLFAWLAVVLRHLFVDSRRSFEVRRRVPVDLDALAAPASEAVAPWRCLDMETVREALPALARPLRDVFELHAAGHSLADIADRLGICASTAGTRLFRARRRLRLLLEHGVSTPDEAPISPQT
jgi:RNA polymerase sigma-70 factor (ECF subfamily)